MYWQRAAATIFTVLSGWRRSAALLALLAGVLVLMSSCAAGPGPAASGSRPEAAVIAAPGESGDPGWQFCCNSDEVPAAVRPNTLRPVHSFSASGKSVRSFWRKCDAAVLRIGIPPAAVEAAAPAPLSECGVIPFCFQAFLRTSLPVRAGPDAA